jgi:hypothetical protein
MLQSGINAQRGRATTQPIALTALDYFEIQQLVSKVRARHRHLLEQRIRLRGSCLRPTASSRRFKTARSARSFRGGSGWPKRPAAARAAARTSGWIKQGVKHIYVNHIITPTG